MRSLVALAITLPVAALLLGLLLLATGGDRSARRAARTFPEEPFSGVEKTAFVAGIEAGATKSAALRTQSALKAETIAADSRSDLPGTFVPSQGGETFAVTTLQLRSPPFCTGVRWSETPDPLTMNTPVPFTPISPGAPATYRRDPVSATQDCYSSNPPTSGRHVPTEDDVEVARDSVIDIPPSPGVYDAPIYIPRAAISFILERAGVFVGYHCAAGDTACVDVVRRLEATVRERIETYGARVVMAEDTDLPPGEVAAAAWTRVLNLPYRGLSDAVIVDFIRAHSCRYDPLGYCQ